MVRTILHDDILDRFVTPVRFQAGFPGHFGHANLISVEAIRRVNGFDESQKVEDLAVAFDLAAIGHTVEFNPYPLLEGIPSDWTSYWQRTRSIARGDLVLGMNVAFERRLAALGWHERLNILTHLGRGLATVATLVFPVTLLILSLTGGPAAGALAITGFLFLMLTSGIVFHIFSQPVIVLASVLRLLRNGEGGTALRVVLLFPVVYVFLMTTVLGVFVQSLSVLARPREIFRPTPKTASDTPSVREAVRTNAAGIAVGLAIVNLEIAGLTLFISPWAGAGFLIYLLAGLLYYAAGGRRLYDRAPYRLAAARQSRSPLLWWALAGAAAVLALIGVGTDLIADAPVLAAAFPLAFGFLGATESASTLAIKRARTNRSAAAAQTALDASLDRLLGEGHPMRAAVRLAEPGELGALEAARRDGAEIIVHPAFAGNDRILRHELAHYRLDPAIKPATLVGRLYYYTAGVIVREVRARLAEFLTVPGTKVPDVLPVFADGLDEETALAALNAKTLALIERDPNDPTVIRLLDRVLAGRRLNLEINDFERPRRAAPAGRDADLLLDLLTGKGLDQDRYAQAFATALARERGGRPATKADAARFIRSAVVALKFRSASRESAPLLEADIDSRSFQGVLVTPGLLAQMKRAGPDAFRRYVARVVASGAPARIAAVPEIHAEAVRLAREAGFAGTVAVADGVIDGNVLRVAALEDLLGRRALRSASSVRILIEEGLDFDFRGVPADSILNAKAFILASMIENTLMGVPMTYPELRRIDRFAEFLAKFA